MFSAMCVMFYGMRVMFSVMCVMFSVMCVMFSFVCEILCRVSCQLQVRAARVSHFLDAERELSHVPSWTSLYTV